MLLTLLLCTVWSGLAKLSFNLFFVSSVSLYALGLLLLPALWQDTPAFSSVLLRCGCAIYEAILFAMLITKAHDNPRYAYLYFSAFGTFANVNYARFLEPYIMGSSPLTTTLLYATCSVFLFLMVVLCLVLFVLQRARQTVQAPSPSFGSTVSGSEGCAESDGSADAFAINIEKLCSDSKLTPRERDVLIEILHGYTLPNAAKRLGIAPGTVRTHMKSIYNKTGAANKQELIRAIDARG